MASNARTQTVTPASTVPQTAETPEEVEAILRAVESGDRLRFGGDEYRVTSTKVANGTPFVDTKKVSGYSMGTRTVKPGASERKPLVGHGRGMVPRYTGLELVERAD